MNKTQQPIAICRFCRCPISWDSKYCIARAGQWSGPGYLCNLCEHELHNRLAGIGLVIHHHPYPTLFGEEYYEAMAVYELYAGQVNRTTRRLGRPLTDNEFARLYQQYETFALQAAGPHTEPGYWRTIMLMKRQYQLASYQNIP